MDTYIIWLSPFPVHLELSQHCLATPWMIAGQAPLSMGFPREEYWSGLTFPLPWDLPEPRIEPATLVFQGDRPSGKPQSTIPKYKIESKKSSVALGLRYSHRNILSQLWKSLLNNWGMKVKVKVTQSCLTLCDPMDSTVHGILQASIREWVAFPFSRGSSQPRNRTQVSSIAGGFFTS